MFTKKPDKLIKVIYDTDASTTCFPIQIIRKLRSCYYNWTNKTGNISTKDASGNNSIIFDGLIAVKLRITGHKSPIIMNNAVAAF